MSLWGAEHHTNLDDVLKYDDILVLANIREDAATDNERSPWAKRLVDRKHHKVIYETGDSADHFRLSRCKRIYEKLAEDFEGADFYLDDAKFSISKLSIPGDQEENRVENLYILERNGATRLLTRDSAIIGKIPRKLRTVRIFADSAPSEFESIRERARTLEVDND